MSVMNKKTPTKSKGKRELKHIYHLTRCDAGLNGLYIVIIKSTHRQRFKSNENVWKNKKNSELDQHSAFK